MAIRKVAAYCRVSTLEQKKRGVGMDVQIRDVTAYAESRNLVIDRLFPDAAESGIAENRKQLQKLLRACERGEIGIVLIPSLDRLSRNVRIAENLFWKFEQLGVHVLIADMPNYNGQDRREVLIRQIREAIAEEARKEIIERLWKGRLERVRKGRTAGGNVPYGYRRKDKRLVEHADEARIVRLIFDLAGKNLSGSQIEQTLLKDGSRQRNGKPWTKRQINAILARRELYAVGVTRYGVATGNDPKLVLIHEMGGNHERRNESGAAL